MIAGGGSTSGLACECQFSPGGGSLFIGPQGFGCFAVGHAGHCLCDDSEFEGCELGDDPHCGELWDAETVLRLLPSWFADYNDNHPHKGLKMMSPKESRLGLAV